MSNYILQQLCSTHIAVKEASGIDTTPIHGCQISQGSDISSSMFHAHVSLAMENSKQYSN